MVDDREILLLKREIEHLKSELIKYKYDYLTDLPGIIDFETDLDLHISDYNNFNKPFILGIVDVNDLHAINRDEGYHMGDATILSVSKGLEKVLYQAGIYRIGGDEFAILCRSQGVEEFESKLHKCVVSDRITFAGKNAEGHLERGEFFSKVDNILIERKKEKKIGRD